MSRTHAETQLTEYRLDDITGLPKRRVLCLPRTRAGQTPRQAVYQHGQRQALYNMINMPGGELLVPHAGSQKLWFVVTKRQGRYQVQQFYQSYHEGDIRFFCSVPLNGDLKFIYLRMPANAQQIQQIEVLDVGIPVGPHTMPIEFEQERPSLWVSIDRTVRVVSLVDSSGGKRVVLAADRPLHIYDVSTQLTYVLLCLLCVVIRFVVAYDQLDKVMQQMMPQLIFGQIEDNINAGRAAAEAQLPNFNASKGGIPVPPGFQCAHPGDPAVRLPLGVEHLLAAPRLAKNALHLELVAHLIVALLLIVSIVVAPRFDYPRLGFYVGSIMAALLALNAIMQLGTPTTEFWLSPWAQLNQATADNAYLYGFSREVQGKVCRGFPWSAAQCKQAWGCVVEPRDATLFRQFNEEYADLHDPNYNSFAITNIALLPLLAIGIGCMPKPLIRLCERLWYGPMQFNPVSSDVVTRRNPLVEWDGSPAVAAGAMAV